MQYTSCVEIARIFVAMNAFAIRLCEKFSIRSHLIGVAVASYVVQGRYVVKNLKKTVYARVDLPARAT